MEREGHFTVVVSGGGRVLIVDTMIALLITSASTRGGIMTSSNDYNRQIIEEFHANGGKVGGMWEHTPLLLLTTTGAKSGMRRTTPMAYMPDGGRLIVWASAGGAPTHPDWYHNLVAHPDVTIEVGTETFDAFAVVIEGTDRDRLWAKGVELYPSLADTQVKTTRQFPLIALSRQEN
jgi:deazaflavin-dependent oxidoreductase (nitroreductase family)